MVKTNFVEWIEKQADKAYFMYAFHLDGTGLKYSEVCEKMEIFKIEEGLSDWDAWKRSVCWWLAEEWDFCALFLYSGSKMHTVYEFECENLYLVEGKNK